MFWLTIIITYSLGLKRYTFKYINYVSEVLIKYETLLCNQICNVNKFKFSRNYRFIELKFKNKLHSIISVWVIQKMTQSVFYV